ncbi:MAG: mechanosensitive ion channel family protein [Myxococcota bacterium]|jgi:MscS family membrane protein|nr:mechanosensitive ion channel family protein [Myxococcota bacterium]
MESLSEFFHYELGGMPIYTYLLSFLAIAGGFLGKSLIRMLFPRLRKVADKTSFSLDNVLLEAAFKPSQWLMVLGGIWIGASILPMPPSLTEISRFVDAVLKGASVWLLIWFAIRLVEGLCDIWKEKASQTNTKLDDMMVPIVRSASKVFLFLIGLILVLQNLGYSVTSLVAGLGIGGAALALASKDTVANLFGSLVIFFDKPFEIGDWIEVGAIEGTVEEIGLRVTRVRTFANSQITVPNSQFTTSAINNWSRMRKRRVRMTIGLEYKTKPEQMDRIVQAIRDVIANDENFHHDFYLVYFDNFGPSSLDIFIYAFVQTTVWADYLAFKQTFMLNIMRTVEEHGASFAFPTSTIHVESFPGEPKAATAERPK